nr:MAG TPA: hypothetical protein [Caudoviricetes sp.]
MILKPYVTLIKYRVETYAPTLYLKIYLIYYLLVY